MLSFKHHLAAAFVVGSLLSSTTHAKLDDYVNAQTIRAAAVGIPLFYLAGIHKADEKSTNPARQLVDIASKIVRKPAELYAQHKDAFHLALTGSILAYYGKAGMNSIAETVKAAHFKAAPGLASLASVRP